MFGQRPRRAKLPLVGDWVADELDYVLPSEGPAGEAEKAFGHSGQPAKVFL